MDEHEDNPEVGHRLGRSFLLLGWLAGFALVIWLFSNLEEAEYNPNQDIATLVHADGSREVTLVRNRYGHYVTSGLINGKEVTLMLDTGASDVSIPEYIANKLGLERGPAQFYNTANGTITAYLTQIDRISIGDIELTNVRASINPNMDGKEILLGMSFLNRVDYQQQSDRLTLRSAR